jgi:hypothetical protein
MIANSTQPATKPKWLAFIDRYLLLGLTAFLIAFIPLFPKIPLFEAIPGYIVRVRMEDILILFTFGVWFIQLLRGQAVWKTKLTWLILGYVLAGFLSIIAAVFVIKSVPFELIHIGKTALHYFRYIEYFSLFFIAYSAIRERKDALIMLTITAVTVIGITGYGYGQKYWYWPVYSTMNREFSKGIRLYLTEHARVQSTFGGHYDLGAYLVVMLPLLLSLSYLVPSRKLKLLFKTAFWGGSWLLVLSASRTSYAMYGLACLIVISMIAIRQQGWGKKIWWAVSRGAVFGAISFFLLFSFGDDIYERFLQVLEGYPELSATYHRKNKERKDFFETTLPTYLGIKELPKPTPPPNSISTDEANLLVPSDERPTTTKPGKPSDVYVEVPDYVVVATTSSEGVTTTTIEERDRVFSDCAIKRGLSLCIRLETLWPMAMEGFYRDPLFGKGYATLNKISDQQFTEAESTDNNFLRTLGETGLFGFITFYGVIAVALWQSFRVWLKTRDQVVAAVAAGYIAGSIGLLLNAIYIDVFAASKVALSYWALTGIVMAYLLMEPATTAKTTAAPAKTKAQPKHKKRAS